MPGCPQPALLELAAQVERLHDSKAIRHLDLSLTRRRNHKPSAREEGAIGWYVTVPRQQCNRGIERPGPSAKVHRAELHERASQCPKARTLLAHTRSPASFVLPATV